MCDGTFYNHAAKRGIQEMKTKRPYVISALIATLLLTIIACVSGLVGSKEVKLGLSGSSGLFCSSG
jgi:hypothetical protein